MALVSGSVEMAPNKPQIKDETKVEGLLSELCLIVKTISYVVHFVLDAQIAMCLFLAFS